MYGIKNKKMYQKVLTLYTHNGIIDIEIRKEGMKNEKIRSSRYVLYTKESKF